MPHSTNRLTATTFSLKTFYRETDGHTYYLKGNHLMLCPTFMDGTPDFANSFHLEDCAETSLQISEEKAIREVLDDASDEA